MEIMTKTIQAKLERAWATNAKQIAIDGDMPETTVLLKLFTPDAQASWFLTEYNPDDRTFFGFCNLGDDQNAELGYVSRDELEALRGGLGLPVERDMHWTPCPLADVQNFEVR
tara:strand:+ start:185 stop:523 length:339 start_codon:yes stop_codon:yes gene_type:complete